MPGICRSGVKLPLFSPEVWLKLITRETLKSIGAVAGFGAAAAPSASPTAEGSAMLLPCWPYICRRARVSRFSSTVSDSAWCTRQMNPRFERSTEAGDNAMDAGTTV